MESKICTKCKEDKTIDSFSLRGEGKVHSQCKACISENARKYKEKNKEKLQEYYKNWKIENRESCREYDKKYREENLERLKKYNDDYNKDFLEKNGIDRHSKYWIDNKDKIKTRRLKNRDNENQLRNIRRNEKRKSDPLYRLEENIKSSFKKAFKRGGYPKTSKTQEILGCTFKEFKAYLESKFESWMNWENRGLYNGELNYGWDIDHIIPICSANSEEEIIKLNHYTNLQPLCSKVNRDIKKDKI